MRNHVARCVEHKFAAPLIGSLFVWVFSLGIAAAQQFPSRAITINLPIAAGGGVDLTFRRYVDIVSRNINQPVVIVNRPGGGGLAAASATLSAPHDGYTLYLATPATHGVMQALQPMPFDPLQDFKAVTLVLHFENVLTISNKIAPQKLDEFIKYGKSKPGGLAYGSPGHGSPAHILGAMFANSAGIKGVHVPFKNGPEMNLSLVRGDLDYGFGTYQGMQAFWRAGQVKILATVGKERPSVFPDYPTMIEAGLPDLDLLSWYGLVAPAGTPDAAIQFLADEFKKASQDKELQDWMRSIAFGGVPEGPASFAALMKKDTERYSKIIPALGIKRQ